MAQLAVGQMGVAAPQAVQRAEDPLERDTQFGQLRVAGPSRHGLCGDGSSHRGSDPQRLGGRLGVGRGPAHADTGFSARIRTTQGTIAISAMPADHQ